VYTVCAKNYENWQAVDKVIAKISRLTFLAHTLNQARGMSMDASITGCSVQRCFSFQRCSKRSVKLARKIVHAADVK